MKKRYLCPAELTVDLIGSKWRIIVLWNLRKKTRNFNELRRLTPGISATNLSLALKHLQGLGLVEREETGAARGEVNYSMTSRGQSLDAVLKALVRWGIDNRPHYASGPFGMEALSRR
ncbi:MAG: helix-turn-helix transcriptional regulator [Bdellovibrionaceae bacterium]|nr:helix-turn-helix transcriptional regulator [Pseudobdellovibrionaceae bacterium]